MKIGDKLKGRISGLQPYGAFVNLEDGTSGLIHISEIRTGYIANIHQILTIGQEVEVQVIEVDEFSGKISLSIRSLEKEQRQRARGHRFSNTRRRTGFAPLEKALPGWTEEALNFLKKGKENGDFQES